MGGQHVADRHEPQVSVNRADNPAEAGRKRKGTDVSNAISLNGNFTTQDSEFELLPDGVYSFTVTRTEHSMFGGSAKLAPCDCFKLTLDCTSQDGAHRSNVTANIYFDDSQAWKITQLLKCIGYIPEDQPSGTQMGPLGQLFTYDIVDMGGWCEISKHTFTGRDNVERESNDVKRFLPPSKAPQPVFGGMGY